LLTWFDSHRRDLPWRRDRDPYRIWISEVMLQQTQVATVIPYYERFLKAFPSLADLATADLQEVLRLWEGLGYYRRARDLHAASRELLAAGHLTLPDNPELLATLPGLGRYTRNAVLSQAFDRRLPIIEANSQRVLCRLFARPGDPRTGPVRKWLWGQAEKLLPRQRAGDFNQSLMELGALVCTPSTPRCPDCPVSSQCQARRLGLQEQIPPPSRPARVEAVHEVGVVVRRGPRVLLVQRPLAGRWAGMWEFPHGPVLQGETLEQAACRVVRDLTGLVIVPGSELLTIRHAITRFRVTISCVEARWRSGRFAPSFYQDGRWLAAQEIQNYPVSVPQRRLARELTAPSRQRRLF
jgi:A/G-specific adenine glycosylase